MTEALLLHPAVEQVDEFVDLAEQVETTSSSNGSGERPTGPQDPRRPVGILPAMLPSHGYQGFSAAGDLSGWVQLADSWVMWWNGRQIANVSSAKGGGARVRLNARMMWDTKDEWTASIGQGKCYAERRCEPRLYPELRLRVAVSRLLDTTPGDPLDPQPGLPPTLEQQ